MVLLLTIESYYSLVGFVHGAIKGLEASRSFLALGTKPSSHVEFQISPDRFVYVKFMFTCQNFFFQKPNGCHPKSLE